MKNLHDTLMNNNPGYSKWHSHPLHQFIHWAVFIMIAVILTGVSLYSIKSLALSYDNIVISNKLVIVKIPPPAQDHILVKFKDNVGQTKKAEVLAKHGFSERSEIKQIGYKLVNIPDSVTPEEAVQNMKSDADVQFAEPDGFWTVQAVPNDPNYPSQWYLPQINAPAAWDISVGTPGVVIA